MAGEYVVPRDRFVGRDVAECNRSAKRVTVHRRGDATNAHAVAPYRLVVEQRGLGVGQQELRQPPPHAGLALAQQRVPPDERLAPVGGETEAGLDQRGVAVDVVAPVAVSLFQPQRVQRVVAAELQPERLSRGDDPVEHMRRELGRNV